MANILGVEHSQFMKNTIDIYAKNKVGQYSKFLSSTPTFVTYYHRNMVQSRQDVGTGGIESETGPRSPIRFNKLLNFPIYNIPELHPDLNYDETGADIDLDLSDLVILPNTIQPNEGDYFIVDLPGAVQYLFRVNRFNFNTIQSNDFYRIDADVKYIGNNAEQGRKMSGQVVETYITVFDNIGTEDKCFLKQTDVDYINSLADLYNKLKTFYLDAFYVRELNTFSFMTGKFSETGRPMWRNDPYVEDFINTSGIFQEDGTDKALVLTPANVIPDDFRLKFSQSLFDAILKRNMEMLRCYCYIVTSVITMPNSIYNVMRYFGEFADIFCYKKPMNPSNSGSDCGCSTVPTSGTVVDGEVWYDLNPMPKCTPTWDLSDAKEYISSRFLCALKSESIDTDDYYELIIYNYLNFISMEYDRQELIDCLEKDERNFIFLPIVIYILGEVYRQYFKSESDVDI